MDINFKYQDITESYSDLFFCYYPPQINKRLIAQSGCFTVHTGKIIDNEMVLPVKAITVDNEKIFSIKIPSKSKKYILRTLSSCGITKARLFPELEYQTKEIRRQCVFQ